MAYQIIVKKRFVNKLNKLLNYLEGVWGFNVAVNFQIKVDKHLDLLIRHPFIGIATSKANVRSLLITKHNRLVYKVSGNKIIILNMYDTRMNPKKNSYFKK